MFRLGWARTYRAVPRCVVSCCVACNSLISNDILHFRMSRGWWKEKQQEQLLHSLVYSTLCYGLARLRLGRI